MSDLDRALAETIRRLVREELARILGDSSDALGDSSDAQNDDDEDDAVLRRAAERAVAIRRSRNG